MEGAGGGWRNGSNSLLLVLAALFSIKASSSFIYPFTHLLIDNLERTSWGAVVSLTDVALALAELRMHCGRQMLQDMVIAVAVVMMMTVMVVVVVVVMVVVMVVVAVVRMVVVMVMVVVLVMVVTMVVTMLVVITVIVMVRWVVCQLPFIECSLDAGLL